MTDEVSAQDAPTIRVVRGRPTAEELAAVVVVLTARAGVPAASRPSAGTSEWSAYWRSLGAPLPPGPGAWQSSGRPL